MPFKNIKKKQEYNLKYAATHRKQKRTYDKIYRDKKKQEKLNIINNLTK